MEIRKYICDVCNKEFSEKEFLPYRILIYHGDEAMIFNDTCCDCINITIEKLIEIKQNAKLGNKKD